MYEEDFVKEEVVSFDIDGRKYKYKPTTAGDEIDWLPQYVSVNKDGKTIHDFGKLNRLKFLRLTEIPYEPKKILNIDKEWKDLTDDQKWTLIRKMPGAIFNKILEKITEIDKGNGVVKKN